MDQPDQPAAIQLLPVQHPIAKALIVYDTVEIETYKEEQLNLFLGIGYEPYAITMMPDPRPDVQARAKVSGGMAMTHKMWLKRPRDVNAEAVKVDSEFTPTKEK